MSENSRVARRRANTPSVSTSTTATTTPKTSTTKAKPTPTDTKRRSVRTTATLKKDPLDETSDEALLIEDELDKSITAEEAQTNGDEEPTNNNTRSKRLRKISNKYSNYAVEAITPSNSTKRKSMTTRGASQQQTPELAKKQRSDSESKSSTTSLILSPGASIVDQKAAMVRCTAVEAQAYERNKLKRIEEQLRKEQAKFSEIEMDASSCSTTASTSSIIVKLPRYNLNNEDSSSILLSSSASQQSHSPIKIKISRNQDDKSKSSSFLIDSSNSQQQKQDQQQTASNTTATTTTITDSISKPIKLNLGELLFKCKKSLGLLASSETEPPQPDVEIADENNDPNASKTSNQDEIDLTDEIRVDPVEMVVDPDGLITVEETQDEIILDETVDETGDEAVPVVESHVEPTKETTIQLEINQVKDETISVEPTIEPIIEPIIERTIESTIEPTLEPTLEPIAVKLEVIKHSEPVITNDIETDSALEPGEIVRPQLPVAIVSNGVSLIQAAKRDLNGESVSQTSKFKKIAPAFAAHSPVEVTKETSAAKIVSVSSNNFVSNLINSNTVTNLAIKTKREIELEKLIEEKNLKTRDMKQFYEKLLREMKQSHEQQQQQLIREIKYNCDLKINEVLKESSKKEVKIRVDFERKLTESKMKQWCACCGKEAIYYCCWNTSYCDEECQKMHWSQHLKTCTRIVSDQYNSSSSSSSNEQNINETHHTTTTTNKYNENNYTSNGSSYNNLSTNHESQYIKNNNSNNNSNDVNSYDYIKHNRQKQQQQQHQQAHRPIQHVRSNFSFQHLTNELQKKIPIQSNTNNSNHNGFANNSNNNNNTNNSNNNSNRKVPL